MACCRDGERRPGAAGFVGSSLYKDQGVGFFASRVELGPNGVEKIDNVGKVTGEDQKLLDAAVADLKKDIEKGVAFLAQNPRN